MTTFDQPDTPYTRFQRAQRTADGMERQRDEALIDYVLNPSVEKQAHLLEAMGGLRQARRELHATMISVMYFVATQEIDNDEERGALEQIIKGYEQRITRLEHQARERAA